MGHSPVHQSLLTLLLLLSLLPLLPLLLPLLPLLLLYRVHQLPRQLQTRPQHHLVLLHPRARTNPLQCVQIGANTLPSKTAKSESAEAGFAHEVLLPGGGGGVVVGAPGQLHEVSAGGEVYEGGEGEGGGACLCPCYYHYCLCPCYCHYCLCPSCYCLYHLYNPFCPCARPLPLPSPQQLSRQLGRCVRRAPAYVPTHRPPVRLPYLEPAEVRPLGVLRHHPLQRIQVGTGPLPHMPDGGEGDGDGGEGECLCAYLCPQGGEGRLMASLCVNLHCVHGPREQQSPHLFPGGSVGLCVD
mmetsp:Transcript_9242/g.20436  ORF Transcript_9242/g.20436 Transcript_9242/m.20436 type:complete len:298 (+) Transcript_9242:295-1188(+)